MENRGPPHGSGGKAAAARCQHLRDAPSGVGKERRMGKISWQEG